MSHLLKRNLGSIILASMALVFGVVLEFVLFDEGGRVEGERGV